MYLAQLGPTNLKSVRQLVLLVRVGIIAQRPVYLLRPIYVRPECIPLLPRRRARYVQSGLTSRRPVLVLVLLAPQKCGLPWVPQVARSALRVHMHRLQCRCVHHVPRDIIKFRRVQRLARHALLEHSLRRRVPFYRLRARNATLVITA